MATWKTGTGSGDVFEGSGSAAEGSAGVLPGNVGDSPHDYAGLDFTAVNAMSIGTNGTGVWLPRDSLGSGE